MWRKWQEGGGTGGKGYGVEEGIAAEAAADLGGGAGERLLKGMRMSTKGWGVGRRRRSSRGFQSKSSEGPVNVRVAVVGGGVGVWEAEVGGGEMGAVVNGLVA